MVQWKIGCSGYHYDEWKGIFYPEDLPQKKWFEYYSAQFNTLELNVTFYRFPKAGSLKMWHDKAPENFTFTVKAPRIITHFKKLIEAQTALSHFYGQISEGLKLKCGPVLFQFPSTFVYEIHKLERIVSMVDNTVNNVVEFRHESWWRPEVFQAFQENNITFCGMSHPALPQDVIRTSDIVYYRFHGIPHLYTSSYLPHDLEDVAQRIQNINGAREAYIYFNNTGEGAAIQNAKVFQGLCEAVSH
jgi:uncharacterized protein YecE (DUF72 family)